MFRNKKEHDEIVKEMDLEKKCHPCTFLEHAGISAYQPLNSYGARELSSGGAISNSI